MFRQFTNPINNTIMKAEGGGVCDDGNQNSIKSKRMAR